MSKLPKEYKFIDVSDYGRPIARLIAISVYAVLYTGKKFDPKKIGIIDKALNVKN